MIADDGPVDRWYSQKPPEDRRPLLGTRLLWNIFEFRHPFKVAGVLSAVILIGGMAATSVIVIVGGNEGLGSAKHEIADVTIIGEPIPLLDPGFVLPGSPGSVDAVVGRTLPVLAGVDFDGSPVEITADGRAKVILLVSHWDSHGQAVISELAEWLEEKDLPNEIDLYLVSTGVNATGDNYPPSAWLLNSGVDAPVLVDDADGSVAAALGLQAYPYWVFGAADGTVAGRALGKLTMDDFEGILANLFGA